MPASNIEVEFLEACGVQMVAVARRTTVRRRACAGYLNLSGERNETYS